MSVPQRFGLTVPVPGVSFSEQREWIKEIADLGYTDIWSAEVDGADAFTPLLLASQWAPSLRLGTAIVPVYTRGPALIAQTAAALAAVARSGFALGLGASSNVIVQNWNGLEFDRPYQRVRDTVRLVRRALQGERITEEFETFKVRGFRLAEPPTTPEDQPDLLVAALRPGMLRLAGRESDGAILNWLSAEDVRTVVPYVHQGGPDKEIVARIFVIMTDDVDTARTIGRRMIATYLNVPVYAAFHEWLGRADRLTEMWSLWQQGDRAGACDAIPDSVVDELIVHGSAEQCRDQLATYAANGVTTVVPAVIPVGDPMVAVRALAPQDS
jgi:probable F420-dependent oxidoreductase